MLILCSLLFEFSIIIIIYVQNHNNAKHLEFLLSSLSLLPKKDNFYSQRTNARSQFLSIIRKFYYIHCLSSITEVAFLYFCSSSGGSLLVLAGVYYVLYMQAPRHSQVHTHVGVIIGSGPALGVQPNESMLESRDTEQIQEYLRCSRTVTWQLPRLPADLHYQMSLSIIGQY